MNMPPINPYAERKFLRRLEKIWVKAEALVNRLVQSDFNPFYHLGTLTIFMLIVLIATGTYLTILYRPGSDRAYETVQAISANGFGSLMRSAHRYASDAMIVLIVLHFLKMLFSDRFWGARWLAWTSGWIMLAATWLVGTMGYWLIWDERAQWMTEYMMALSRGNSALTFTAADLASKSFATFVIILFLHVFLPLFAFVGVYIHVIRNNRARWWSPRWAMIQSAAGLLLLALLAPVQSAAPADFSRIVVSAPMDALYLGFLPMIDKIGNIIFWGLALFVGGGLFLLPWLSKGRHLGPAQVINHACTGCALCAVECPYYAIKMVKRSDGSHHEKLAAVSPSLCVGCGICVGACPVEAIELKDLPNNLVVANLRAAVERETKAGHAVTVVFACQRDLALGTLRGLLPASSPDPARGAPVLTFPWGTDGRVVLAVLPDVGMADTDWVPALLKNGVRDVIFLACPHDDCIYREGTAWILNRIHRHSALIQPGLHFLENTPGETRPLAALLDDLHKEETQKNKKPPVLPPAANRAKLLPPIAASLANVLLFTALFALALPLEVKAGLSHADQGGVRIAYDSKGKIAAETSVTAPGVVLPEGADPAQIFGGKRYPVTLRLIIDGEVIHEKTYEPAGLRGEGRITFVEFLSVPPGVHQVEILIQDDGGEFQSAFSAEVSFTAGHVVLFRYDEEMHRFEMK